MRRAAGLLVAAVLALAGCGGSSSAGDVAEAGPAPESIVPEVGVVSRSYGGTLDLEVTGAVEARWSGTTPLSVLTAVDHDRPRGTWQLTVGLLDAVDGGGGWTVRPAFDLIGYAGDGAYTIEPVKPGGDDPVAAAEGGKDAAVAAAVRSTALLVAAGHGVEPTMYTELAEPCALEVRRQGLAGSLDCPSMKGPGGAMAVRWSWDAHADQVLAEDVLGDGDEAPAPDGPVAGDEGDPGPSQPPAAPDPGGEPAPGDGDGRPAMPLEIRLDKACYERGQAALVTITTEPDAALGMAVAFSDARPYGLYQLGRTDPQGTFRWAFTIPPDAPTGEAHVLVSAGSSDGERANSDARPFAVEESC